MILERLQKRIVRELDALHKRIILILRVGKCEREIIHRRQDIPENIAFRVTVDIITITSGTLLVIVKISLKPSVEIFPIRLRRLRGFILLRMLNLVRRGFLTSKLGIGFRGGRLFHRLLGRHRFFFRHFFSHHATLIS